MNNTPEHTNIGYSAWEECYGTVECCCRSGAFLRLDNGEAAFAYGAANLRKGVKTLCTVRRPAQDDRRVKITVDSVLWDEYKAG